MRRSGSALALGLLVAACGIWYDGDDAEEAALITQGGIAAVGEEKIRAYGCGTCHTIPGVAGARGAIGPPLTGIASRMYFAGSLSNTPQNLMLWIQDPRAVDPGTAMPDVGVTEADARHIAAYLYTLR